MSPDARLHRLAATALLAGLAACAGAPPPPTTRDAEQALLNAIDAGRSAHLDLYSFAQLNAQPQETEGAQRYRIAFQAEAAFSADALYVLETASAGAGTSITTARAAANAWDVAALADARRWQRARRGDHVQLEGDVMFEWRSSQWVPVTVQISATRDTVVEPLDFSAVGQAAAARNAPPQPAVQPGNPAQAVHFEAMLADLRRLVMTQEVQFATDLTYSSDLSKLPGFSPNRDVTIRILSAGATGWSAEATHSRLKPHQTCGAAVGEARPRPTYIPADQFVGCTGQ